jgi:hypothetical protein
MRQSPPRRCAICVDTETFMAAQELAELAGIDVDTFIEITVKGLHAQACEALVREKPASAPVIPITRERRRRRRSG